LTVGLCPDPLGELKRSHRPLTRGRERGGIKAGRERGKGEEGRKEKGEKEGEAAPTKVVKSRRL